MFYGILNQISDPLVGVVRLTRAKERPVDIIVGEAPRQEQVLTDAQKEEISQLRQQARAKLAEIEILQRDALAAADPARRAELEQQHRVDRERIESRLETAVKRVKQETTATD